ncbi:hypothetical protein [Streptomyces sp. MMS24-I29]|uniref:hypothetical protein n=1 Tax=Streptomyces sp. MMS24-I29 TaxID=3351480 RepID=UPI003C7DE3D6
MSGISSRLTRWLGRRGASGEDGGPAARPAAEGTARTAPHTVLEEHGERFLLRSSDDRRASVRDLARGLPADPERPVVVVDVAPEAAGNLGEELGGLLARLRDERRSAVRLVMSGAAAPSGDRAPLAQRLADAWELELEAPDAPAVLVPGGGLYVPEPATPAGGWWRFGPGTEPEPLGARVPAPRWQRALARVPLGELGGCTVQQIPAGLLVRPSGTAPPRPGEPAFALAVHPDRPTVLVGAVRAGRVPADDLATLLAGLPAELRRSVRLAPGDGRDLVPLAEDVTDLLGLDVEVCTGLPLAAPSPGHGAGRDAGSARHTESVRLMTAEGDCTWPALLTSVICSPAEADGWRPSPRPAHWLLPGTASTAAVEPAASRLPDGGHVVAVRAGLWIGATTGPPADVRDRPADARAARIEVDAALTADTDGRARLLENLSELLAGLDDEVREYAELTAPADADPGAVTELRRFAVRNGLTFATTAAGAETAPAPGPAVTPVPLTASPPVAEPAAAHEESPRTPPTLATTAGEPGAATATGSGAPAPAVPVTRPASPHPVSVTGTATESAPVQNIATVTAEEPGATAPPATATSAAARTTTTGSTAAPASGTTASAPSGKTPAPRTPTPSPDPAVPPLPSAPSTPPTPSAPSPPAISCQVRPAQPAQPAQPARPARPARSRTVVPAPARTADDADRAAFRELAAAVWEEHSGPVNQALIRLPGLRGPAEDAARADLVAVRLYLTSPHDGPFGALALAVAAGANELRPYAACLSSGLSRLPALRGTLVRAVPGPDVPDDVVPGAVLRTEAPLDVVHLEAKNAPVPPPEYVRHVIRPLTARRISVLTRDGSGTGALFAPGTAFSVLARHEADGDLPARVLLAELPSGAGPFRSPSDEAVARMETAARRMPLTTDPPWPGRCTGPFHSAPDGR